MSRVTGEFYRAVVNGGVWVESKNPAEVIERSEGKEARFEKITYYETTDGWQPWNPDTPTNGGTTNE